MAGSRRNFNSNGTEKKESPKVKLSKESLREALVLFSYIKPYRAKFILSLIFIALSAFSTSLFPLFLGKMIDAVSPGTVVTGASNPMNASPFRLELKDIHWSLNTTLLLIFIQLSVQTV